jgi:glutathione S-transferase
MVLKLYGNPGSTCTKRIAVVLYEKKIPFELHVIDFTKGEHKAPAFLEKQPFGQVPYLVSTIIIHIQCILMKHLVNTYDL